MLVAPKPFISVTDKHIPLKKWNRFKNENHKVFTSELMVMLVDAH